MEHLSIRIVDPGVCESQTGWAQNNQCNAARARFKLRAVTQLSHYIFYTALLAVYDHKFHKYGKIMCLNYSMVC